MNFKSTIEDNATHTHMRTQTRERERERERERARDALTTSPGHPGHGGCMSSAEGARPTHTQRRMETRRMRVGEWKGASRKVMNICHRPGMDCLKAFRARTRGRPRAPRTGAPPQNRRTARTLQKKRVRARRAERCGVGGGRAGARPDAGRDHISRVC